MIYLTYSSFNEEHIKRLDYTFNNAYPSIQNNYKLNETIYPYSECSGTTTEVDKLFPLLKKEIKYYDYYYKIKIINNITKTNYF